MPDKYSGFLPDLCRTAQKAGAAILMHYAQDIEVERKADNSPVTVADLAAHHIILDALSELTPDIPVISEESEHHQLPDDASIFWLVDPLDGTKSFIRKTGQFTVNIALIENGTPTLGVIYIPVEGMMYAGAVNEGAWRQRDGAAKQTIATRAVPPDGYAAVLSFSHLDPKTEAFIAPLAIDSRLAASSSLKFCRVAEGVADIYPRFGPTMEWDTAAGHAIVLAAGGRVETPEGTPFSYRKDGFLNGPFIVWGR